MTQKQRKEMMNCMTYIQLQEVIDNGNRILKQPSIIKAEKNNILKNIKAAQAMQARYKDVQTTLSGNFN